MNNTEIFKIVNKPIVEGIVIGKPYIIRNIVKKYYEYDGVWNRTYGDFPDTNTTPTYAIYCGCDEYGLYFKSLDILNRYLASYVDVFITNTNINNLSINDADIYIEAIRLNSYKLVKEDFKDSEDKKKIHHVDMPKYDYTVFTDERHDKIITELTDTKWYDRKFDECLKVKYDADTKIFKTNIFDGYDKIYVVIANGDIHTKTYSKEDVTIDDNNIKFADNFNISVEDVEVGNIDFCDNIINIHVVGGDMNV